MLLEEHSRQEDNGLGSHYRMAHEDSNMCRSRWKSGNRFNLAAIARLSISLAGLGNR